MIAVPIAIDLIECNRVYPCVSRIRDKIATRNTSLLPFDARINRRYRLINNDGISIRLPYRSQQTFVEFSNRKWKSVRSAAWFLALTAINLRARECVHMRVSEEPRCDVSPRRFHRKAHRRAL